MYSGRFLKYGFKDKTFTILNYTLLVLFAVSVIFPVIWLFISSFKNNQELFLDPWGLPSKFRFDNYSKAWVWAQLDVGFRNSVIIMVTAVILIVAMSAMVSYVIARSPGFKSNLLLTYFLIGMMIPVHSLLVPLFMQLIRINLVDNLVGVIMVNLAFSLPTGIYIMTNYMKAIPIELEEAGIIDGCSYTEVFRFIIVPVSMPVIIAVGVVHIIFVWNEYLFSMLLITRPEYKTLPLLLTSFQGQWNTEYTMMFAAIFMAMVPVLIFYIILQRFIIEGMAMGAVKG